MRIVKVLGISIFGLLAIVFSTQASAQSGFSSHASVCEAIRPANGHKLLHTKEGLENPSDQAIWVSCPVTTEVLFYNTDHAFVIVGGNLRSSAQRMDCILRYFDSDTEDFRTVSRNLRLPGNSGEVFIWELYNKEIAQPNISCKMGPRTFLGLVIGGSL